MDLNVPLKIAYEDLFKLTRELEISVADSWVEDEWFIEFKRSLSGQEYERWSELSTLIIMILLSGAESKGSYTTKSLYRFIMNGGSSSRIVGCIWKSKVPLKIKFFLWQIFNNKLQCAVSLVKRGWKGGEDCCLGDGC